MISIFMIVSIIGRCHPSYIGVPAYSNTGSFVEYGVKAWNELPDILRCTTSRTEFKRELKTHLFSPYE